MSLARTTVRDDAATPDAGPEAGVAQSGGTPGLRDHDGPCRAPRDTGTFAAFALRNGPGM